MAIAELARGTRKTRKPHRCYDCGQALPIGSEVGFFTGAMDGSAYTLYHHPDCEEARHRIIEAMGLKWYDFDDDGQPPLIEILEGEDELAWAAMELRGHLPHVACRLDLRLQRLQISRGIWQPDGAWIGWPGQPDA